MELKDKILEMMQSGVTGTRTDFEDATGAARSSVWAAIKALGGKIKIVGWREIYHQRPAAIFGIADGKPDASPPEYKSSEADRKRWRSKLPPRLNEKFGADVAKAIRHASHNDIPARIFVGGIQIYQYGKVLVERTNWADE